MCAYSIVGVVLKPINRNLYFLTLEFSILQNDITPFSTFFYNLFHNLENLVLSCADLRCGISFAKGNGAIFDCLEVNSDTERSPKFVVSGVSTTNRLRGIIYFVGDPICTEFKCYNQSELEAGIQSSRTIGAKLG